MMENAVIAKNRAGGGGAIHVVYFYGLTQFTI